MRDDGQSFDRLLTLKRVRLPDGVCAAVPNSDVLAPFCGEEELLQLPALHSRNFGSAQQLFY